jgi:AMP phosphorylase
MDGRVLWINNEDVAKVAREAGAPKQKGAGVILKKKLGEHVKKGGVLFEVYAERNSQLEAAVRLAKKLQPVSLSKKPEERMVMNRIPTHVRHETVLLER